MMPQRVRLQYEAAVLNPSTVYTSHGPTVIMPTWFCSRLWFLKVGPFDEGGKGVPEDLLWFYQSLRQGGGLIRVDECLLIYRYHEQAATHSVLEESLTLAKWKVVNLNPGTADSRCVALSQEL
ncbi:UDP-GlcNAc:betaGal beta-1,3-N-acetylglucosaminyltransferase-like protein 1 isoform X6 [Tachysurus ichikawai]